MMDELNMFIRPRIPDILICLLSNEKRISISYISKKTGITYSHLAKLTKKFNLSGLIHTEKVGREQIVSLTQKGRNLAELFDEMYMMINKSK